MRFNGIFNFVLSRVQIHFDWTMRSENETVLLPEVRKSQTGNASTSYLMLDVDFAVQRTFRCMTNNSLGAGQWCEIDVAGECLAFLGRGGWYENGDG